MRWLRKRIRKWRRDRAALAIPEPLGAVSGTATLLLCHPSATGEGPTMRTVLRPGPNYPHMWDTEIRGFLDGSVKFRRNVATQYHVRIGCEASKPDRGRYEVMRVLQRWDLSPIPAIARVKSAALTLTMEDIRKFPHRHSLISPVDFYLYEVKKTWGPGRGGVKHDNQSEPEPGDAGWLDARHGELPWAEPGCGLASDTDSNADRGAEPLACVRAHGMCDSVVFSGPRLAAHVQRMAAAAKPLDLLLKASDALEARPGSIRAFYSREFGDDLSPSKRPGLAVEWTAPTIDVERRPFVLEPGQTIVLTPAFAAGRPPSSTIHASLSLDAPHELEPALFLSEQVRIESDVHAVRVGDSIVVSLLETWTPDVERPGDLQVQFQFTAPSGRAVHLLSRWIPPFTHSCEFRPDELGVWRYSWRVVPDRRFPSHTGSGCFTVVRGEGESHTMALRAFAEAALAEAAGPVTLVARGRLYSRLTRLEVELGKITGTETIRRAILDALAKLD